MITQEKQEKKNYERQKAITMASYYIDLYFCDKDYDKSIDIYSMRFVKLVINSRIIADLHLVYECLSIEFAGKRLLRSQYIDKVLDMLYHCAMCGIPKSFATGIILMEYIICKGIDILDD